MKVLQFDKELDIPSSMWSGGQYVYSRLCLGRHGRGLGVVL